MVNKTPESERVSHYPTFEEFDELCPKSNEELDLPPDHPIRNEQGNVDFFTIFHGIFHMED